MPAGSGSPTHTKPGRATIINDPKTDYIGGKGVWSTTKAFLLAGAYDKLGGAGVPAEYAAFRQNLGFFTAQKLNELAGSALTPGEIARYGQFLPGIWQSAERIREGIKIMRRFAAAARTYEDAMYAGKTPPEARLLAKQAMAQVYEQVKKEYKEEHFQPETAEEVEAQRMQQRNNARNEVERRKARGEQP